MNNPTQLCQQNIWMSFRQKAARVYWRHSRILAIRLPARMKYQQSNFCYEDTTWEVLGVDTNKLQTVQYSALRTITGCTLDTNTHHPHTETKIPPIDMHMKLHGLQLDSKHRTLNTHYTCSPHKNLQPD